MTTHYDHADSHSADVGTYFTPLDHLDPDPDDYPCGYNCSGSPHLHYELNKLGSKHPGELWSWCVGEKGRYAVSNRGRIVSFVKISQWHKSKARYLSTSADSVGYPAFTCTDKYVSKSRRVHVEVARAFVEGYQPGLCVNHIDGVKTNNDPSNLEWVTPSENNLHAYRTGLKNPSFVKPKRGAIGIDCAPRGGRGYYVRPSINKKRYYFGFYMDRDEAKHVRDSIVEQLLEAA